MTGNTTRERAGVAAGAPAERVRRPSGIPLRTSRRSRLARQAHLPRLPHLPARPHPESVLPALISRLSAPWSVEGPNPRFLAAQLRIFNILEDRYFRMEMDGWERLPYEPSLLVGIHSGGALTMDAWTVVGQWYRRFGRSRILHGTAHDGLMAAPGLAHYFRLVGVIPARRDAIEAAFAAGHDVILWPGGEVDAMRSWRKRDKVVLGERKGFIRMAIRQGVPIVPVATVGGADTAFVLTEGRRLARITGLKRLTRSERLPLIVGLPFGIAPELLPTHVPLPAKIRTELLEPLHLDPNPERAGDQEYVDSIYHEIERRIQEGVDRLASRRRFPVFG